MNKKTNRFFLSIFCVLFPMVAIAQNVLEGVRMWQAPNKTRLVFDLTAPVEYTSFSLDQPKRLVLDFSRTRWQAVAKDLELSKTPIQSMRQASRGQDDLRVVLDFKQAVKTTHFVLPPKAQYGHRLVVDVHVARPVNQVKDKSLVPVVQNAKNLKNMPIRKVIVAIDPGHGGEDPGAIGIQGTKEKDIVLSIAKKLKALVDKEPGMQAVLTRENDYFIPLQQRRMLARDQYQADIFISIHADAWKEPKAHGASVFVLSRKGASSALAGFLADSANASDQIGGATVAESDPVLRTVLADLAMEGSLEHSFRVGKLVLDELDGVARLHKRHVEQAGFMVLKSLDIPSLLVETGFISNPGEEKLLRTSAYQNKLAKALLSAVKQYFHTYPPPDTFFASKQP